MSLREWLWSRRYLAAYLALISWFAWRVGRFHDPTTGFSSLVMFGDRFAPQRLPQLHDVRLYTLADSDGYDGQFYAQLAVAGNPLDHGLAAALDSPAYRSRRLLIPELAFLVGLGRPSWIVNVYALSNLLCWLVLGWALASWWFPPTDWHNMLRWAGTLFGSGMVLTVTHSLTDGPALLGIALGARCVETNRRRLAALAFIATGFVRETGAMGAAALVTKGPWRDAAGDPRSSPAASARHDDGRDRWAWLTGALVFVGCGLPALAWAVFLVWHYGRTGGAQAFAWPLTGFVRKLIDIERIWRAKGFGWQIRDEVWGVIALPVQVGFIIWHRKPNQIWWRIGAAFAFLWFFLAWPGWEGTPSAVTRYVLPLTLAFNVLVPRTRLGLVLLVVGNLTVLSAPHLAEGVASEQTTFTEGVTCDYATGWYGRESLDWRTWRWARGPATMDFHNPGSRAVRVTLDFEMSSVTDRTVVMRAGDVENPIALAAGNRIPVRFGPFPLPPGPTTLTFTTPAPVSNEHGPGGRGLAFSLHRLNAVVAPIVQP